MQRIDQHVASFEDAYVQRARVCTRVSIALVCVGDSAARTTLHIHTSDAQRILDIMRARSRDASRQVRVFLSALLHRALFPRIALEPVYLLFRSSHRHVARNVRTFLQTEKGRL